MIHEAIHPQNMPNPRGREFGRKRLFAMGKQALDWVTG
jgi:hypothetical protein